MAGKNKDTFIHISTEFTRTVPQEAERRHLIKSRSKPGI